MTTQERLRLAAAEARKQRPRPTAHGQYLHELLDDAADEMDRQIATIADLCRGTP